MTRLHRTDAGSRSLSTGSPSIAQQKASLRQTLRKRRRDLGRPQQRHAARAICRHLMRSTLFQRARDISLYLDNDGEVGTRALIQLCSRANKRVWLPEVTQSRELRFLRYQSGDKLIANPYGILQPQSHRQCIEVMDLDLVLMPLVAFDRRGMRLGMGGGFYDRAFQGVGKRQVRPKLVGLGHGFQEIDCVPANRWDKPLHAVATERGLRRLPD